MWISQRSSLWRTAVAAPAAYEMSLERCRQAMLASRRSTWVVDGQNVLVDTADTVSAAVQVPYENPDIRRVVAIYELSYRRPRSV